MSNVAHIIAPQVNPLAELQKAFCLITLAGEVRVMSRHEINDTLAGKRQGDLSMYQLAAGKLLMGRYLEALPASSDARQVIREFLDSPKTHVYNAVAFNPTSLPTTTLNYWAPSPVVPQHGDWSIIRTFLQDVICDGNGALFEYLYCYLAHMLQRPEDKPGVIIVLLGGQGTGKGTLFRLLRALWPQTCLQVSDIDHVVGSFNARIERNYAICMDEALFEGDKRALDRLKSLITEPTISVEQKYQPRREIESYHRFFAASNHRHFAQVDADDRRFVFLRVSESRKGDLEYWESVYRAIDDPAVVGAMVYDLLNLDLADFKVRNRPKTAEHVEQKLRSLTGFERYWFEVLQSGNFHPASGGAACVPWDAPMFVSTETLLGGLKGHGNGVRQFVPQQERDLHQALKRLCPAAKKGRKQIRNRQERGYNLPGLPDARAEFDVFIGGEPGWDT